jgi:hypothetical protein
MRVPKMVKNGFYSSFVYWRARLPLNATNPPEAISRNATRRSVCQVQDEGCTIFARPPTIKKLNNAAAAMNSALATISRRAIFVTHLTICARAEDVWLSPNSQRCEQGRLR